MASSTTNEVILEGPDQFHTWFSSVKGSVPRDLWKYFDPDTADEFLEPEPVTFESIKAGARSLAALNSTERSQYTSLQTLYNYDTTQSKPLIPRQRPNHLEPDPHHGNVPAQRLPVFPIVSPAD
jgi:hypothetical protein